VGAAGVHTTFNHGEVLPAAQEIKAKYGSKKRDGDENIFQHMDLFLFG
jgi:hypothetical protein